MRDFTTDAYEALLKTYKNNGYRLCSYLEYLQNPELTEKVVILRHDVDLIPARSLRTAQIETELGATGTYYFRIVPESLHEDVIKAIADLGHEIGYHYEDMALCNGDMTKSYEHFKRGLSTINKFYPVKTICMHGSPMSKWDNRMLWEKYNYKEFGIIAEPYFDLDFNKFFYLTDTGRQWNKTGASVRDVVKSDFNVPVHSTADVIELVNSNKFPTHVMQNIHPQRWVDNYPSWLKELVWQNTKNVVKTALVGLRSR